MWQLLTKKPLCWSLFLILNIAKFFRVLILKNICKRQLLKMCLWKLFITIINFTLKTPNFFNIGIANKRKCSLLFHDWFPVKFEFIPIQHFFGMMRNRSSQWRCSVGGFLRNFAKFLGKHLCQSFRPKEKWDPDTGVFLWILQNFQEHLFYRTPLDDCFLRSKL